MNKGLEDLKRIYQEAYENDPVVRDGFDGMAKLYKMENIRFETNKNDPEVMDVVFDVRCENPGHNAVVRLKIDD